MDIIRWDSWNSFHCAVIKSDTDANYLVGGKGEEGGRMFSELCLLSSGLSLEHFIAIITLNFKSLRLSVEII